MAGRGLNTTAVGRLPLSSLLSQVLVAFTVEIDNELEHRMRQEGYKGHTRHSEGFISLAGWLNCMQFLRPEGMTVAQWEPHTGMPPKESRGVLGCAERWGYVVLEPPREDREGVERHAKTRVTSAGAVRVRAGFGSSIGIGLGPAWQIRPTPRTVRALEVWLPLVGEIEERWRARFGEATVDELHESLSSIVDHLDPALPLGLPDLSIFVWLGGRPHRGVGGLFSPAGLTYEPVARPAPRPSRDPAPLCVLAAKSLLAFALEFNTESAVPIAISANHLRVLDDTGLPPAEVRRRTGVSNMRNPQHIAELGLAELAPNPHGKRGKVLRLTASGLQAKRAYEPLAARIEDVWATRFGEANVRRLRNSLHDLLTKSDGPRRVLAEGLTPPPGLPRAGDYTPEVFAAWPKKVQSNVRHLVEQTRGFMEDPLGTLPHYPIWDGDRGWGP